MMRLLGYFILSLVLATLPMVASSSPLLARADAGAISIVGAIPPAGMHRAHSPHGAVEADGTDAPVPHQPYPACCIALACMAFLLAANLSYPGVKRITESADPSANGRNGAVVAPNPPPPRI